MTELNRIPWRRVEPLDAAKIHINGALPALDALRNAWEKYLSALSESDRVQIQQRTLRKLSIETGIIERIYDIEWGLTLTLVSQGFTKDVIERAGGKIDDKTIETLKAQKDSLEMVLDFVRDQRKLSTAFVKELHSALTRTQLTHIVFDSKGNSFEVPLEHGTWKTQANHVTRQDGSVLEYTPPEHVAAEMDRLVELFESLDSNDKIHPIIKSAWLHHTFVCIHPFADGNGRVARALTLLALARHKYAPLVVDRHHREDYLKALDAANLGDLTQLVKLFVRLESASLTSELDRPEGEQQYSLSSEVAHTLAAQLAALQRRQLTDKQKKLGTRATAVQGQVESWFKNKRTELLAAFKKENVKNVAIPEIIKAGPKDEKSHWFKNQIVESAHGVGHYADFSIYRGWISLLIRIEGTQLRYVASIHGAGRNAGVVAVTTFAEIEDVSNARDKNSPPGNREFVRTAKDAFRFVDSEEIEAILNRSSELYEMLDFGLMVALLKLRRAN